MTFSGGGEVTFAKGLVFWKRNQDQVVLKELDLSSEELEMSLEE